MIPSTTSKDRCQDLWGICAYFNPLGYRRRLWNYREFRRHLPIPLVTVELGFDGRFDLDGDDADILIRCTGDDVLWQRERLWNLALQAVPADCQKIARLDGDILLESPDWPEQACRLLEDFPLIQLFTSAYDQPADGIPGAPGFPQRTRTWESFASCWQTDRDPGLLDRRIQPTGVRSSCAMGLAWAFRRDLHADLSLYDACILGGAEHAMLCAACGAPELVIDYQHMSDARRLHYLDWAGRFHRAVEGRWAALPGNALHLWHGDIAHRGYGTRYQNLRPYEFDPARDLALNECGVWKWNSSKPEMHAYVRQFFADRRDDG